MKKQTRRYFGTDGVRGRFGESLINPEFVLKLGWAIGKVLVNGKRSSVIIGKDTRISGYLLESALEAGLSAAGVDIKLLGPMPTPAIAYLTRTLRSSAGVVISASHNLYHDNGIKFFSALGQKLPDELELAIEKQLDEPLVTVDSAHLGKAIRIVDAPGRYIEFCKSTIAHTTRLSGMKIVVDCANGATYHIAPNVFRELGAEVVELAVEPDGFNINHQCGSTDPAILQKMVLEGQADLGIAFDGDGDRVLMVDNKGELLDGDELLYIIAKDQKKSGQLQGGVVATVMSNLGLEQALQALGIDMIRTKVGDRYVIEALQKYHWQLGGESSGHIICLDKITTGDGIIAALQVLSALHDAECSLHEFKQGMVKFPQARIDVKTQDAAGVMNHPKLKQAMLDVETQLNGHGRVLLRPSGTEPVTRIMVEGQNAKMIDQCARELADMVKGIDKAL